MINVTRNPATIAVRRPMPKPVSPTYVLAPNTEAVT